MLQLSEWIHTKAFVFPFSGPHMASYPQRSCTACRTLGSFPPFVFLSEKCYFRMFETWLGSPHPMKVFPLDSLAGISAVMLPNFSHIASVRGMSCPHVSRSYRKWPCLKPTEFVSATLRWGDKKSFWIRLAFTSPIIIIYNILPLTWFRLYRPPHSNVLPTHPPSQNERPSKMHIVVSLDTEEEDSVKNQLSCSC